MMGNTELIFLFFIVLLLFGARKLPELARSMGEAVREFNKATTNPIAYMDEKTDEADSKE